MRIIVANTGLFADCDKGVSVLQFNLCFHSLKRLGQVTYRTGLGNGKAHQENGTLHLV